MARKGRLPGTGFPERKLTDESEDALITYYGLGKKSEEIQELLRENYGVELSIQTIRNYRLKYRKRIKLVRGDRERLLSEVPIAHIAHRIDKRQAMIDKLEREGFWYTDRHGELRNRSGEINRILDSVAAEMSQLAQSEAASAALLILQMNQGEFMKALRHEAAMNWGFENDIKKLQQLQDRNAIDEARIEEEIAEHQRKEEIAEQKRKEAMSNDRSERTAKEVQRHELKANRE